MNTIEGNKYCNKNNGFTLSEIIVIIAILGVIATISVMTTYKNIKKREIVSNLKNAYSILNDTITRAEANKGKISGWNFNSRDVWGVCANAKDFAKTYIVPYIDFDYECVYGNNTKICFSSGNNEIDKTYGYNSFYGISGLPLETYNGGRQSYMFKTKNGMSFAITKNSNIGQTVRITVDVNGPNKGNSRAGEDVFVFTLDRQNGLKAYGDKQGTSCISGNITSGAQSTGGGGATCGGYIIKNNWAMPKDYPLNFNPSKYYIVAQCKNKNGQTSICYPKCNDKNGLDAAHATCTP